MKISVIIPYNKDRGYLQRAIESVKDAEVILSYSDGTRSYNINQGLKKVTTEYVKFLDEDDMLTENCIYDSLEAIKGYDFIHGNAINFTPDGTQKYYKPSIRYPTVNELVLPKSSFIHNPTQMYKMDIFEKVGYFDETLLTAQDWEFNLRCLSKGMKIGYCDKFLVYYRIHDGQITKNATEQKNIDKQRVYDLYCKY